MLGSARGATGIDSQPIALYFDLDRNTFTLCFVPEYALFTDHRALTDLLLLVVVLIRWFSLWFWAHECEAPTLPC
jgi:hypothetical protein